MIAESECPLPGNGFMRGDIVCLPLLTLSLIIACAPARAEEAAWRDSLVSKSARETCEKATKTPLPAADEPTAAEKAGLKNCSSSDLYYGVKGPQDYAAARKCAFIERSAGKDRDFTFEIAGPAVLMMIYGNGHGVAKNDGLALKFACEAGGAPAEIDARLSHIETLERSPDGKGLSGCDRADARHTPYCHGVLDICDDITSGAMGGVCAALHSDIEEQKAAAEFSKVTQSFTPAQAALFATLQEKAGKYFDAHASNEIDMSGTARGEFYIEARDAMLKTFRNDVADFEHGKAPNEAAASYALADRKLNEVYARTLKRTFEGTIDKDGVRSAQRAWLPYRDAFVQFAASRYPAVSADTVKALLTRERTATLGKIGE
jgi:uncharacterized protein YecT (DUF1311 family)